MNDDPLNTVLAMLKHMESTLLGLKQLRGYVDKGAGSEMLETIIAQCEAHLQEIKRKFIQ